MKIYIYFIYALVGLRILYTDCPGIKQVLLRRLSVISGILTYILADGQTEGKSNQ